ncbi:MAG: hypothetical protein M1838_004688 [Thelocarpon superellum]|nr:MAG: hypothetical protein M1838_004688 [Thelocarpon superellum]
MLFANSLAMLSLIAASKADWPALQQCNAVKTTLETPVDKSFCQGDTPITPPPKGHLVPRPFEELYDIMGYYFDTRWISIQSHPNSGDGRSAPSNRTMLRDEFLRHEILSYYAYDPVQQLHQQATETDGVYEVYSQSANISYSSYNITRSHVTFTLQGTCNGTATWLNFTSLHCTQGTAPDGIDLDGDLQKFGDAPYEYIWTHLNILNNATGERQPSYNPDLTCSNASSYLLSPDQIPAANQSAFAQEDQDWI